MNRAYLAEALGTFILMFFGTGAIVFNEVSGGAVTHSGICLTFGLVVMILIYVFGDVSGTHINPAVTLTLAAFGLFPKKDVLPYLIFQAMGAFAGTALLLMMYPQSQLLGATMPTGGVWQSFVLEFFMTFFLMLTVLMVANGKAENRVFIGLIVGSVVWIEAQFGGPISGASMNPIRSLAPAVVSMHLEHSWIYILAPIAGALLGGVCWKILQPQEN